MNQQELIADIVTGAEIDPTSAWKKSESRLTQLMLELAEDQLNDHDEAAAMISAIEHQLAHPKKQTFIELNYPVVKAWCTVKAALDCGQTASDLRH